MALDKLLERLTKAAAALQPEPATAVEEESSTPEQVIEYCASQLEKMATDTPETMKARKDHLVGQLEAIVKNFEGPTPGKITLQMFKDPGQQTTTTQEGGTPSPNDQSSAPSNFATNPNPSTAMGVGSTPSGGVLPPQMASGSGFVTNFSKAISELAKALKGDSAPTAATPEEPSEPSKVEKSVRIIWPNDMNVKDAESEEGWDLTESV